MTTTTTTLSSFSPTTATKFTAAATGDLEQQHLKATETTLSMKQWIRSDVDIAFKTHWINDNLSSLLFAVAAPESTESLAVSNLKIEPDRF